MKAFYESAIEPECPRPDYDPAMDEPEPPAPRRKPPFETTRNQHGQIHRLPSGNAFTGKHAYGKWACIDMKSDKYHPTITCDRRSLAAYLKHLRKGGQSC
jgi:hypothetical protein